MRILIVDDSFIHRRVLLKLLSAYGECDIAVDGQEAVAAVKMAFEENNPYDLICLDITMPNMDGQEALREIRKLEELRGISGLEGEKVIMTTALDKSENIFEAFRSGCEAYIIKPFGKEDLAREMNKLGLLSAD